MRPLFALTALAGLFALSGCGEGSVDNSPDTGVGEDAAAARPASSSEYGDASAPADSASFAAEGAAMELVEDGEARLGQVELKDFESFLLAATEAIIDVT